MSQIAKERSDFMPELSALKLYMPLTADRTRRGHDDPTELSGRDLLRYEDVIRQALRDNQDPDEAERGIMHWYGKEDTVNQKVRSVVFTVESREDELWGVAECRLSNALTPEEMVTLTGYISGQASDGWCEGLAQRKIRVAEGGFGCSPDSRGQAVYATCLSDGEKTRWNRADFLGVLDEQYLPDWAMEKLEELRGPRQEQDGPSMDGMTMQ